MDQIQNRYDRADYLLESVTDFQRENELLWDIVGAMSDREFHGIYNYICRMRDIEPDIDKYNEYIKKNKLGYILTKKTTSIFNKRKVSFFMTRTKNIIELIEPK